MSSLLSAGSSRNTRQRFHRRAQEAAETILKAFAARAKMIAQQEGLDGKPLSVYVKLAQKHGKPKPKRRK